MLDVIDAVYIRSPLLAIAPSLLKRKLKKMAVVIPRFTGDELASKIKNRILKMFIYSLYGKIDQQVIRKSEILLVHGSFFGGGVKTTICI